ncbi:hypothetical protein Tco_0378730 [Tanacetum coccineum]
MINTPYLEDQYAVYRRPIRRIGDIDGRFRNSFTMEEYIRLEEEKARKSGKVFNWETAKYGKIWYDEDIHNLRSVETEFPAIAFNDGVSSGKKHFLRTPRKTIYLSPLTRPPPDIVDFKMRLARIYRREVHRVQVFDFGGLSDLMAEGLSARMLMEHRDAQEFGEAVYCSLGLFLHMGRRLESRFCDRTRSRESARQDSSTRGDALQYSWEGVFKHEKLLEVFVLGRKSGALISGEQFVARLTKHFGLLTEERLGGLTDIAPALPVIDMDELVRLQICIKIDDTWDWVALGPERQPDVAAGAPGVAQDASVVDEGDQAVSVPVQAPQPPPAAARTMPQRLVRLEEDVHEICRALAKQREVIGAMARDFSRFTVWVASGIAQLLDSA